MKILVISLAGIGDTLMATPLIHELRLNFPQATLDALVMWAGSRDLLEGNPHLNNVFQKNLIKLGHVKSIPYLLGLQKNKYDLSFNTHPQSRVHYRVVSRLIKARRRFSHDYGQTRLIDRLLVNATAPQNYGWHCVENNLALLPLGGAKTKLARHHYEIFLTASEQDWAANYLKQRSAKKYIGFHVGSGGTKNLALRRWPLKNYLALIKKLNESHPDLHVLLFGGPEEERDHAQILSQTDKSKVSATETKNIRQAAALLKHCELFLSVDTALMHLAAAAKVSKQFVIETPTFNATVEPYGQDFVVIKNPVVAGNPLRYYQYDGGEIRGTREELIRCMESIQVIDVYNSLAKTLPSV